jgi:hypothetical protein
VTFTLLSVDMVLFLFWMNQTLRTVTIELNNEK